VLKTTVGGRQTVALRAGLVDGTHGKADPCARLLAGWSGLPPRVAPAAVRAGGTMTGCLHVTLPGLAISAGLPPQVPAATPIRANAAVLPLVTAIPDRR